MDQPSGEHEKDRIVWEEFQKLGEDALEGGQVALPLEGGEALATSGQVREGEDESVEETAKKEGRLGLSEREGEGDDAGNRDVEVRIRSLRGERLRRQCTGC